MKREMKCEIDMSFSFLCSISGKGISVRKEYILDKSEGITFNSVAIAESRYSSIARYFIRI